MNEGSEAGGRGHASGAVVAGPAPDQKAPIKSPPPREPPIESPPGKRPPVEEPPPPGEEPDDDAPIGDPPPSRLPKRLAPQRRRGHCGSKIAAAPGLAPTAILATSRFVSVSTLATLSDSSWTM